MNKSIEFLTWCVSKLLRMWHWLNTSWQCCTSPGGILYCSCTMYMMRKDMWIVSMVGVNGSLVLTVQMNPESLIQTVRMPEGCLIFTSWKSNSNCLMIGIESEFKITSLAYAPPPPVGCRSRGSRLNLGYRKIWGSGVFGSYKIIYSTISRIPNSRVLVEHY